MNKHYRIIIQLAGLLFLSISQSFAQSISTPVIQESENQEPKKFYDVEIIIFKFNTPIHNGEVNLPTPTAIRTENTIDFSKPEKLEKAIELEFTPLLPDEYRLQEPAQKITKSSRYTLLSHIGWRQPGLGESDSIPVWISGGKIYGKGYSSIDQIATENKSLTEEPVESDPSAVTQKESLKNEIAGEQINMESEKIEAYPNIRENEFYELDGLITIILSRYLHAKTDLVFRKPADTTSIMMNEDNRILADLDITEGQLLLNYGLNEKRRMRSKKLHYLDNPHFGMLVMITPYEAPIEIEPTETINPIVTSVPVNDRIAQ